MTSYVYVTYCGLYTFGVSNSVKSNCSCFKTSLTLTAQAQADTIFRLKNENSSKLEGEYQSLVEGLRQAQERRETEQILANPVLPEHVLHEAVPGSIR